MYPWKTWRSISSTRVTLVAVQGRAACHCWGSVAMTAPMFVYHGLSQRHICVVVAGRVWWRQWGPSQMIPALNLCGHLISVVCFSASERLWLAALGCSSLSRGEIKQDRLIQLVTETAPQQMAVALLTSTHFSLLTENKTTLRNFLVVVGKPWSIRKSYFC